MLLTVELNTEICIIANFCFLCTTADEVVNVRIPVLPVDWFTTKLLSRWVAVGEKQLWKRAWEFHVIHKTAYFSVLSRTCCYIRGKRKTNFITKNSQNILVKILTPLTRRWIQENLFSEWNMHTWRKKTHRLQQVRKQRLFIARRILIHVNMALEGWQGMGSRRLHWFWSKFGMDMSFTEKVWKLSWCLIAA